MQSLAKLQQLPSQAIIDGFRGKIDFYIWNGIPCARRWPKKIGSSRAPTVEAQWPAFTFAAKNWVNLSAAVKEAYNQMAVSTNLTGKDIFIKSYISNTLLDLS